MTSDSTEHRVLVIVGPTAVGKTDLSLSLADLLSGEIVSADSRQVYRFMDIGTAKPTPNELAQVKHHFINTRNPDQYYSAGEFGREARECIENLQKEKVRPLVVGGSGFYIRALVDGLFAPQVSDSRVKEKWNQLIQQKGNDFVYDYLKQIDPESADRLHPNDSQRIIRALEVYELSGTLLSSFKYGEEKPAKFEPLFLGLSRPRQELYERIERRVDMMLQDGLLQEVEDLRTKGYGPELNSLNTVGYKEVFEFFAKNLSYEEMVNQIKKNTRRYAKRQMTWFRKDKRIQWIDMEGKDTNQLISEIKVILKANIF